MIEFTSQNKLIGLSKNNFISMDDREIIHKVIFKDNSICNIDIKFEINPESLIKQQNESFENAKSSDYIERYHYCKKRNSLVLLIIPNENLSSNLIIRIYDVPLSNPRAPMTLVHQFGIKDVKICMSRLYVNNDFIMIVVFNSLKPLDPNYRGMYNGIETIIFDWIGNILVRYPHDNLDCVDTIIWNNKLFQLGYDVGTFRIILQYSGIEYDPEMNKLEILETKRVDIKRTVLGSKLGDPIWMDRFITHTGDFVVGNELFLFNVYLEGYWVKTNYLFSFTGSGDVNFLMIEESEVRLIHIGNDEFLVAGTDHVWLWKDQKVVVLNLETNGSLSLTPEFVKECAFYDGCLYGQMDLNDQMITKIDLNSWRKYYFHDSEWRKGTELVSTVSCMDTLINGLLFLSRSIGVRKFDPGLPPSIIYIGHPRVDLAFTRRFGDLMADVMFNFR